MSLPPLIKEHSPHGIPLPHRPWWNLPKGDVCWGVGPLLLPSLMSFQSHHTHTHTHTRTRETSQRPFLALRRQKQQTQLEGYVGQSSIHWEMHLFRKPSRVSEWVREGERLILSDQDSPGNRDNRRAGLACSNQGSSSAKNCWIPTAKQDSASTSAKRL